MYGKYCLIFQYGEFDNAATFLLSTRLLMIVNTVICVMISIHVRLGWVICHIAADCFISNPNSGGNGTT